MIDHSIPNKEDTDKLAEEKKKDIHTGQTNKSVFDKIQDVRNTEEQNIALIYKKLEHAKERVPEETERTREKVNLKIDHAEEESRLKALIKHNEAVRKQNRKARDDELDHLAKVINPYDEKPKNYNQLFLEGANKYAKNVMAQNDLEEDLDNTLNNVIPATTDLARQQAGEAIDLAVKQSYDDLELKARQAAELETFKANMKINTISKLYSDSYNEAMKANLDFNEINRFFAGIIDHHYLDMYSQALNMKAEDVWSQQREFRDFLYRGNDSIWDLPAGFAETFLAIGKGLGSIVPFVLDLLDNGGVFAGFWDKTSWSDAYKRSINDTVWVHSLVNELDAYKDDFFAKYVNPAFAAQIVTETFLGSIGIGAVGRMAFAGIKNASNAARLLKLSKEEAISRLTSLENNLNMSRRFYQSTGNASKVNEINTMINQVRKVKSEMSLLDESTALTRDHVAAALAKVDNGLKAVKNGVMDGLSPSRLQRLRAAVNGFGGKGIAGTLGIGLLYGSKAGEVLGEKGESGWWNLTLGQHAAILAATSVDIIGSMAITEGAVSAGHYMTPSKWKRFWGDHLDVRPSDGTYKGFLKNVGKWGAATAVDGVVIEGAGEALQDYFAKQAEVGWTLPSITELMFSKAAKYAFPEEREALWQSYWGGLVGGTLTSAAITPIQTSKLEDGIGGDDSQDYTPSSVNGSEFNHLRNDDDGGGNGGNPPDGTNAAIDNYSDNVQKINDAKATVVDENGNLKDIDLGGAKDNNADAIATLEHDINNTNEAIQKTEQEVAQAKEEYNKVKDDPNKQAEAVAAADTVKEAEEKLNKLYEHKEENQDLLNSYRELDEQTLSGHAATLAKDKIGQKKKDVTDEQFNAAIAKIANAKNNEERAEAIKEFTNDIIDLTAEDEKAMTAKINNIKGREADTPLGDKDDSAEAEPSEDTNDDNSDEGSNVDTDNADEVSASENNEETTDDSDDDDNGGGGGGGEGESTNSDSSVNVDNTKSKESINKGKGKTTNKKETKSSKSKSSEKGKAGETSSKPKKRTPKTVKDEMNSMDDSVALMSILGSNATKGSQAEKTNQFIDDNFDVVEIDSLNDVSMDGSAVSDARNKNYRYEQGMSNTWSEAEDLNVIPNATQIVSVSRYLVVYDENGQKHTYDTRLSKGFAEKIRNTGKRARELLHDDIQKLIGDIVKELKDMSGKEKVTKQDVRAIKDKVISLREDIDKRLDGLIAMTDLIKFIVGTNPNSEVARSMAILAQNVAIRIDELDRQSKELVRQCREFNIDIKTNKPAKPIDETSRISSFAIKLKNIMGGIFDGVSDQIDEAFEERTVEVHSNSDNRDIGRRLSNLTRRAPFTFEFNGKTYTFESVEHAYQTLKSGKFDSTAYNNGKGEEGQRKPKGKEGKEWEADKNTNYQLMVDLIKASFTNIVDPEQRTRAQEFLKSNNYFRGYKFTHTVNDVFWRTAFPKALKEAFDDLNPNKDDTRASTFDRLGKLFKYIAHFLEPLTEVFDATQNAKIELIKNNLAMINHAGLNGLSFNNPYAPLTMDPTTTIGIFTLTQDMVQNFFSFKDTVSVARTVVNAIFKTAAFDTKTFSESSSLMGHFKNVKINFHPGYWNAATKKQLDAAKDVKSVEVSVADLINLPNNKIADLFTPKQINQAIKKYNASLNARNKKEAINKQVKNVNDLSDIEIDLLRETLKQEFVIPALFKKESKDGRLGTYNSTLTGLIEDAVVENKAFLNNITNVVRAGIIVKAHTLMNTNAMGLENGDLMFNLSYLETNERQKLFDVLGLNRNELTDQEQHDIWSLANFGANTWLATLVNPRKHVTKVVRGARTGTLEKKVYYFRNEREVKYENGAYHLKEAARMRLYVDPQFLRDMKKRYQKNLNKIFHDISDNPFKDISNKPFRFNKTEFREKSLVALSRTEHHIVIDPKTKENKVAKYFRTMFGVSIDEVMDEILSRPPVSAEVISEKRNRVIKQASNSNKTVKEILNEEEFVNEDNPFLYIPIHTYEKVSGKYVQTTKYYYAPNFLSNPRVRKQLGSENINQYFGDFYNAKFGYFSRRAADIASVIYIYGNYRLNTSKKAENKEKFKVFEGNIDFSKPVFIKHRLMESTRAFTKNQIVNPSNKIIRDLSSYRSNNKAIWALTPDGDIREYTPSEARKKSSKNHTHKDAQSFMADEKVFNGAFYAFMQIFGKDVDKLQLTENGKEKIKKILDKLHSSRTNKNKAEQDIRDILSKEVKYKLSYQYKHGKQIKSKEVDLLNDVFIPLITEPKDSKEFNAAKSLYDKLCNQYSAENMSIWDDHPALSMNNKAVFDKFLDTKNMQDLDTSALQVYIDGAQTGVFENMVRFQGIAEMDILSNVYRGNLSNLKFSINKETKQLEFNDKGIDDTNEVLRRISLLTPREATDVMTTYNELIQSLSYEGSELYYAESLKRDVDPYILTMALMMNQMSKFKGTGNNLFINLTIKGNMLTRDAMKKIVLPYLYGSSPAAIYNTILAESLEAINSNMYSFMEEFLESEEYNKILDDASSEILTYDAGSPYISKARKNDLERAKQTAFRAFLIRKGMGISAPKDGDRLTLDQVRTLIDLSNEYTDDVKSVINRYLDLLQSFNPTIKIVSNEDMAIDGGQFNTQETMIPGEHPREIEIPVSSLSNPTELVQALSHELGHATFNLGAKTKYDNDDSNRSLINILEQGGNTDVANQIKSLQENSKTRAFRTREFLINNFREWYNLLPEARKKDIVIDRLKTTVLDFNEWLLKEKNQAKLEKNRKKILKKDHPLIIAAAKERGTSIEAAQKYIEAEIYRRVENYIGDSVVQGVWGKRIDKYLLEGTDFADYNMAYHIDPLELFTWMLTSPSIANSFIPFLNQKKRSETIKETIKKKGKKKEETVERTIEHSALDDLMDLVKEDTISQIDAAEVMLNHEKQLNIKHIINSEESTEGAKKDAEITNKNIDSTLERLDNARKGIQTQDGIGSSVQSDIQTKTRKGKIAQNQRFAAIFGIWLLNNPEKNTDKLLKGVFKGNTSKDPQSVDYGRLSANIFGTNNGQLFDDIGRGKDLPSSIIEGTLFSEEMQDINDYCQYFQITNKVSEMYFDDTFKQYWKPITTILKSDYRYKDFLKELNAHREELVSGKPINWADAQVLNSRINAYVKEMTDGLSETTDEERSFKAKRKEQIKQNLRTIVENTQKAFNYSGEFLPSHTPASELSIPPDIRITRKSAELASSMKANVESIIEQNMEELLDKKITQFLKDKKGIDVHGDVNTQELVEAALTDAEFTRELIDLIYNERQKYYEALLEKTYSDAKEQLRTTLKASNIDTELKEHIDEVSEKVYKKIFNEKRRALALINKTDKKSINRENIILFVSGKFPKTTTVSRTDLFAMPNVLGLFNHNLEAAVMAEMCAELGIDTQIYDGWITNSNGAIDSLNMWNQLFAEMHDGVIDIPTFLGTIVSTSMELGQTQGRDLLGYPKFLKSSLEYLVTISNKQPVVTKNIRDAQTLSNTDNTERFDQEYDFVFKRLVEVIDELQQFEEASEYFSSKWGVNFLASSEEIARELIEKYGNMYTQQYIADFNESLHSNEGDIFFNSQNTDRQNAINSVRSINNGLVVRNHNEHLHSAATNTNQLHYIDVEDMLYLEVKFNNEGLKKVAEEEDGVSKLINKTIKSFKKGERITVESFVNRAASLYIHSIILKFVKEDPEIETEEKRAAIINHLSKDEVRNNMFQQAMDGNWCQWKFEYEYNGSTNTHSILLDINESKEDARLLRNITKAQQKALSIALNNFIDEKTKNNMIGIIQRQYKEAATVGFSPVFYVGKKNVDSDKINKTDPSNIDFMSSVTLPDGKNKVMFDSEDTDVGSFQDIMDGIFNLKPIRKNINNRRRLRDSITNLNRTYAQIMLDNEARRAAAAAETTNRASTATKTTTNNNVQNRRTRLSPSLLKSLEDKGATIKIIKGEQTAKDAAMTEASDISIGFSPTQTGTTGTNKNMTRASEKGKTAIFVHPKSRVKTQIKDAIKRISKTKKKGDPVTIFFSGSRDNKKAGIEVTGTEFANTIKALVKEISNYANDKEIDIHIVVGDASGVDTVILNALNDEFNDLSDVTVYSTVGDTTTPNNTSTNQRNTAKASSNNDIQETSDSSVINNTLAKNVKAKDAPKKLYYQGNIDLLSSKYNKKRVAIIGTRGAKVKKGVFSFPGEIATRITNFVNGLKNDAIIVSGLAKGADFTAMNAAVNSGKKVIAILPCSPKATNWFLDQAAHDLINRIIANGGLVISENNGKDATPQNLISRDRLQAYYSSKVLLTASDISTSSDRGSIHAMNWAKAWGIPTAVFERPAGNKDPLYAMNDYFKNSSQILGNTAASENITPDEAQRLIDEAQDMTPEEFKADLNRRMNEAMEDPTLTAAEKAAIKESYETLINLFDNAGKLKVKISKESHEAKGLQITNQNTRESSILLFANNDTNTALHEYIHSLMNFALNVNSNVVNILKDRIYYVMQQVKETLSKNPALMARLGITKEQFDYIFNNPNGINASIQEFMATFLSTPKLAAWLKTQQFTPGKNRWSNIKNAKTIIGKAINVFKALLGTLADLIGSVMLSNKKNLHNMLLETTKQMSRYNTKEGIERIRRAYQNHPLVRANKFVKSVFHLATGNVFKTAIRYLEERGLSEDYIDQFRQEMLDDIEYMREPLTAVIAAMESDKNMSLAKKALIASIGFLKMLWRSKHLIFSNPVKRHFVITALNEYRQQLFEGTWLDAKWPIDLGIRIDKQFDDIRRNVDKITNLQNAMSIEEEASAVAIRDEVKGIILSDALPNLKKYVEKRWKGDTTRYEQSIARLTWFVKISDFFYGQKEINKNELLDIVNRALTGDKDTIAKNNADIERYVGQIMSIIESNSNLNPDLIQKYRYFVKKAVSDLAYTRLSRKHNTIGLSNVEQMIHIMNVVTSNWAIGNRSNEEFSLGATPQESEANYQKIVQTLHRCVTLQAINLIHNPKYKNAKDIAHIRKDTSILTDMHKEGNDNLKADISKMMSLITQIHHDSEARNNQQRVLDESAAAEHFRAGKDITDRVYEGSVYKTEGSLGRSTKHPYYTEGYIPFERKPDDVFIVRLEVDDANFEKSYNYYKGLGFEDFVFSDSHEGGLYDRVKFLKYNGKINYTKNRSEIGYRFTDRLPMGHHQEFFVTPQQEGDPENGIPNYWDVVFGKYMRPFNRDPKTGEFINKDPYRLDLNEFYLDKRTSVVSEPGSRRRRDNINMRNLEELTEPDYTVSNLFYNQEKKIFKNNTSNFVNNNVMSTLLDSQESIKKRPQGKKSRHHHAIPLFRIAYRDNIPSRDGDYIEGDRVEVIDPVGLEMEYGIRFNRDDLANLAKLMRARGMFNNLPMEATDDSRIIYADTRTMDFLFGFNKNIFNKDVYGDQKNNPAFQKKISAVFSFLRGLIKETRNNTIIRNPNLVFENFKSNIVGLLGEGIPPSQVFGSIPVVIRQLNQYQKLYKDAKKLETQISARKSTGASNYVEAQQRLEQINRELASHPMHDFMKAGGFYTNIVEDSEVVGWKWDKELIDKFADKVGMSEQSKNYLNEAMISEDSETYKSLAYFTRLGDFVPRVIYANYLMEYEGLSKKEAIIQARDRFVNYNTPIWSPVLRNMDFFALVNYAKYGISMQRQALEAFAKSPIQVGAILGANMAARVAGVPKALRPTSYLGESVLFGDSLPSGIINGGLDRMFNASFRHYYMLDSFGAI